MVFFLNFEKFAHVKKTALTFCIVMNEESMNIQEVRNFTIRGSRITTNSIAFSCFRLHLTRYLFLVVVVVSHIITIDGMSYLDGQFQRL